MKQTHPARPGMLPTQRSVSVCVACEGCRTCMSHPSVAWHLNWLQGPVASLVAAAACKAHSTPGFDTCTKRGIAQHAIHTSEHGPISNFAAVVVMSQRCTSLLALDWTAGCVWFARTSTALTTAWQLLSAHRRWRA